MQVVLVMFRNDGERRSFSVVRNMTVIGRREDCDLRIPVGDVSRKHCRLVRTDDGIRIEDLGSSNGTYVNGQRVQEGDLNAGDVVGIGPVQFIVQIDGVPDDDEMTPPAERAVTARDTDDDSMAGHVVPEEELMPEAGELEHAEQEQFQLEEEPAAADEQTIDEVPLDEAPAEEEPLEELSSDALELEEEQPAAHAPQRIPPRPQVAPPAVNLEENVEELSGVEEPLEDLEPVGELEPVEELEPLELEPAQETVPSAIEPVQEKVDLGGVPKEADQHDETAVTEEIEPVDLEAAGDSEWDFVVEESDSSRSDHDFKIDLDSPHQQPHQ